MGANGEDADGFGRSSRKAFRLPLLNKAQFGRKIMREMVFSLVYMIL